MYKIKQLPEDFYVREIPLKELRDSGKFLYFTLKKRNYTTLKAIEVVANALHIAPKRFGFAGTKDRVAVTEQNVSVSNFSKEKLMGFAFKDIEIEPLGYCDEPLSLGELQGNYFEIVVRGLDSEESFDQPIILPNLFGPQRFSSNNSTIGKAIVKRDFKKAVELLKSGDVEDKVQGYLKQKPTDYVGALRQVPKKLLRLYVHAYQSGLWNETAVAYIDKYGLKDVSLPIIGFGTETDDENVQKIIDSIMKKEKLDYRDFVIRQIPELTAEGGSRKLLLKVEGFKALESGDDEQNPGKKKMKVAFTLPKGSYATVVIDKLFSKHNTFKP